MNKLEELKARLAKTQARQVKLADKVASETDDEMRDLLQEQLSKSTKEIESIEKNIETATKSEALLNKDWKADYAKFPGLETIHKDTDKIGDAVNFSDNKAARVTMAMLKKDRVRSILLQGPSGTGKTTMIRWFGSQLGRPVIAVDASGNLDEDDFLGKWGPGENGTPVWTDGPLLIAMKSGSVLVVEEINSAKQSILIKLNSLLDDLGQVSSPKDGTIVKAQPGFIFAGTFNKGYAGTRPLNKAFINRFDVALEVNAISETKHKEILKKRIAGVTDNYINIAWQVIKSIENFIETNEHDAVVSVRQSEKLIKVKMTEDEEAIDAGNKPSHSWTNAIKMGVLNQSSGYDEDVQKDIKKVAQHLVDNIDKKSGKIDKDAQPLGSMKLDLASGKGAE